MKKLLLVIVAVLAIGLSGCDQFFSELEITFFNMKRIAYIQMDITMKDIPNQDPLDFVVKTDGINHITEMDDEISYTYLDENKDFYELFTIDESYYSYKLEQLGAYDLDITTIMELFLLAPQDFKLDKDGYYRPTVILYDFEDLEFKVEDGYITKMNFKLKLNDDLIDMTIVFSDVNLYDLDFPEYIQFTEMEQIEYFLQQDNQEIIQNDLGFDVVIDDVTVNYINTNDYLIITDGETTAFYDIHTGLIREVLASVETYTVRQYNIIEPTLTLSKINLEEIVSYYHAYQEDLAFNELKDEEDPLVTEPTLPVEDDTTETDDSE